jgi:hypothetical protein
MATSSKNKKLKEPSFIKRRDNKLIAVFVDGVGLDRATKRINKRVNLSALVRGVSAGHTPISARYYSLLPFEDDARQSAFLDAVSEAGLDVVIKRLPPKNINVQVTVAVEMTADIMAFALGKNRLSSQNSYKPQLGAQTTAIRQDSSTEQDEPTEPEVDPNNQKRVVVVVCPSKELSYSLALVKEYGVDTISADFGEFNPKDVLKSASKWIDLSNSETIWFDE